MEANMDSEEQKNDQAIKSILGILDRKKNAHFTSGAPEGMCFTQNT
jgi:hypothetical protein